MADGLLSNPGGARKLTPILGDEEQNIERQSGLVVQPFRLAQFEACLGKVYGRGEIAHVVGGKRGAGLRSRPRLI